ncbi:MAG: hypothetical protein ABIJ36_02255 [Patescibacteria group bacterium]|nr:hypothetical protein [Patescibacteria group bacterium]
MKFTFFGDFVEESRQLLKSVGESRGHTCETPADVVFMMAYSRNIPLVQQAIKLRIGPKPLLLLRAIQPRWEEERAFWRTRRVRDIVNLPYDKDATEKLFAALEAGDTSSL